MIMDKVAIQVHGAPSFFAEVAAEAARIDRSPSWLVAHCLSTWLPALTSVEAEELAERPREPAVDTRVYWLPRDLLERCVAICDRFDVPADALFLSVWERRRQRS
jgi:hypothetical protein